ncbi:type IV pilus modification protein PilV [Salinicola aestuarinus]|uniref:type IV pilus modification protein PilV n=1 Tax=Salinicola aestuarinus TaxID=1949082 RepID=UPI0013001A42|nr:type IV pilus modification protein PilV [Salinicola aestuarinus]
MSQCRSGPIHQRGLSLIEVLVALVVFSVGLLGTATLLAQQARLGAEAGYRSLAVIMAEDLLERIKLRDSAERHALAGHYAPGGVAGDVGAGGASGDTRLSLEGWGDDWYSRYAIPGLSVCTDISPPTASVTVVWRVRMALPTPDSVPACVTDGAGDSDGPAYRRWVRLTSPVAE